MIEVKTRESILMLRQQGEPFTEIAKLLSLSPNTVKSICHRSGIHILPAEKTDPHVCKNCGQPLIQIPGKPATAAAKSSSVLAIAEKSTAAGSVTVSAAMGRGCRNGQNTV